MKASDFVTLSPSLARFAAQFTGEVAPWEWLKTIGVALAGVAGETSAVLPAGVHASGQVWVHPTVKFLGPATLIGPVWIGAHTEVRPGAFIRGNVVAGEHCVLGNASEFKNCVLMDRVQAPHFNYVGDSILGERAHLGAGAICSNLRLDQQPIVVRDGVADRATGLKKFGAILGDGAEVGCNAVLQPGTILGRRALVMPLTAFGGILAANTIARSRQSITTVARRD